MTDCSTIHHLIDESVHGRLGPEAQAAVAAHLDACPACRTLHDRVSRQRAAVALTAGAIEAPPELRAALLRSLSRASRQGWLGPALSGALAATLILVAAATLLLPVGSTPPSPVGALIQEAVDDHIRVVLRQRTDATGPSDPEALRQLMGRVLDYPVPAPISEGGQFRLAGGRPSYVAGHAVACFYYQGAAASASLFVLPLDRLREAASFTEAPVLAGREAYRVAYWTRGGLAYVLVSDAPEGETRELAALFLRS